MLSGARVGYSLNSTEETINPLFVSPTTDNFHSQSTSSARGAGINLGFSEDYAGEAVTSPLDVGAYQY
jgi:hypothetical protein